MGARIQGVDFGMRKAYAVTHFQWFNRCHSNSSVLVSCIEIG